MSVVAIQRFDHRRRSRPTQWRSGALARSGSGVDTPRQHDFGKARREQSPGLGEGHRDQLVRIGGAVDRAGELMQRLQVLELAGERAITAEGPIEAGECRQHRRERERFDPEQRQSTEGHRGRRTGHHRAGAQGAHHFQGVATRVGEDDHHGHQPGVDDEGHAERDGADPEPHRRTRRVGAEQRVVDREGECRIQVGERQVECQLRPTRTVAKESHPRPQGPADDQRGGRCGGQSEQQRDLRERGAVRIALDVQLQ